MMKTYDDIEIIPMRRTGYPDKLVQLACDITQKRDIDSSNGLASEKLIKYLIKAEHTSVLEHCSITVLIRNVSRSFLAQITRSRICSFTAGSQHYQEYSGYEDIIHPDCLHNTFMVNGINHANESYERAIETGIPPEEARQVLPNAKAVNILWTVNARALITFFRARLCSRNVTEMQMFSIALLRVCMNWWPNVFNHVGPPCVTDKKCNQGRMRAQICKDGNGYLQTQHT